MIFFFLFWTFFALPHPFKKKKLFWYCVSQKANKLEVVGATICLNWTCHVFLQYRCLFLNGSKMNFFVFINRSVSTEWFWLFGMEVENCPAKHFSRDQGIQGHFWSWVFALFSSYVPIQLWSTFPILTFVYSSRWRSDSPRHEQWHSSQVINERKLCRWWGTHLTRPL